MAGPCFGAVVWKIEAQESLEHCNRRRGEHLDDDVPIVQQAEQAEDAADAHMSVGTMEVISGQLRR